MQIDILTNRTGPLPRGKLSKMELKTSPSRAGHVPLKPWSGRKGHLFLIDVLKGMSLC